MKPPAKPLPFAPLVLLGLLSACSEPGVAPTAPGPAAPARNAPAATAAYPAQVLNLANWKLTLPLDQDGSGAADEVQQPALNTFEDANHFFSRPAGDAVVFRAYADGATTSGSGYPRSELREMKSNGTQKASWSSTSGTHTLVIDQAVTHLPVAKPHIVVGQIHDGSDDVLVFRLEGQKLFVDINGDDGPTLTSSYQLGTRFTVKFVVSGGKTKCYYNNTLKYTLSKKYSKAYFKAGAYVQSSCRGSKKVSGEACSAYGEVQIYDVRVTHN
ncbi:polysaccharide lyase family 7 protein [Hymenobacter weizhouensis]|uniref:polysaccharide lyase family 7 protein n=1 Tax=Hymenobacter sp. YIM 151500-1 TaxID=2987689 RepID=UPI002226A093|nr:polysaccharide lyase family 7 protein [Hymenobacter sp. YIM 151500-1]UYZ63630.1 polysaccharide lyase family 7 protein [Hymenobacter sp. YIM 151500-1]